MEMDSNFIHLERCLSLNGIDKTVIEYVHLLFLKASHEKATAIRLTRKGDEKTLELLVADRWEALPPFPGSWTKDFFKAYRILAEIADELVPSAGTNILTLITPYGDKMRVELTFTSKEDAESVHIRINP